MKYLVLVMVIKIICALSTITQERERVSLVLHVWSVAACAQEESSFYNNFTRALNENTGKKYSMEKECSHIAF